MGQEDRRDRPRTFSVRLRYRHLIALALLLGSLLALAMILGEEPWSAASASEARETAREIGQLGSSPHVRVAPLLDPLRHSPVFPTPAPEAATAAATRTIARLRRIERNTHRTRYQHATHVNERRGEYDWDCSGMAGWVLARTARRARRALGERRPVARTFARAIARSPTSRARRGWQRLGHIRDLRPGDLFAWEKPPNFPSESTGHVGFVINAPVRLARDRWAVRILDSTSLPHQDDSRGRGHSGTGRGTMTFLTDGEGHATAYGWHGQRSLGYIHTPVYFGRVH